MPEDRGMGNPDAAQDEALIQSVMERNLGPIFEAMGARLKDLEEDLGETKDLLFKFTEGLIGAADNHRRTTLSGELSSKYGKLMEPFEGFYKDTQGKGMSESLLEELMGEGGPDDAGREEFILNKIREAQGKYGKYVGMGPKEEAAAEAAAPEAPMEEAPVEAPAEAAPEEMAAEEEPVEVDPIAGIMEKLKSVGGEKHSLSAKRK